MQQSNNLSIKNNSGVIVAKFGGSSMASPDTINQVASIIKSDKNRKYIVVSAPGKRHKDDIKITDLLIKCSILRNKNQSYSAEFDQIEKRYKDIYAGLKLSGNIDKWIEEINEGLKNGQKIDWIKSRGEWLSAKIFARFMDFQFIDAQDLIRFDHHGNFDPRSYKLINKHLAEIPYAVIPGFYGSGADNIVKTFPRGGSDITGAVIAKGLDAACYENWTDVNGLFTVDPRIIPDSKVIGTITYEEIRELGGRGAQVLQRDTILSVFDSGIPINIRNTFNPSYPGTMIVKDRDTDAEHTIVGIAGQCDFVSFEIKKYGLNDKVGIGSKILEILREENVSYEHNPSGLDNLSIIVNKAELDGKTEAIKSKIRSIIKPDSFFMKNDLGIVCIVGLGIKKNSAFILSQIFSVLHRSKIHPEFIDYSTRGNNIVIGLKSESVNKAVIKIYEAFFGKNPIRN